MNFDKVSLDNELTLGNGILKGWAQTHHLWHVLHWQEVSRVRFEKQQTITSSHIPPLPTARSGPHSAVLFLPLPASPLSPAGCPSSHRLPMRRSPRLPTLSHNLAGCPGPAAAQGGPLKRWARSKDRAGRSCLVSGHSAIIAWGPLHLIALSQPQSHTQYYLTGKRGHLQGGRLLCASAKILLDKSCVYTCKGL